MSVKGNSPVETNEMRIDARLKISALWIVYMFLFIYIDYYKLFMPEEIKNMMSGMLDGDKLSQMQILLFAIITIIPAIMIFLTISIKAQISRLINIILGLAYTAIGAVSLISQSWPFWIFLNTLLVVVASLIVIFSWRWNKKNRNENLNSST